MVGHAGSTTRIVHVDVTLAESKVKVKFRKLRKICTFLGLSVLPFWRAAQN